MRLVSLPAVRFLSILSLSLLGGAPSAIAQQEQLVLTAEIGRFRAPDNAIQLIISDEHSFIEYPDLDCRGILLPAYDQGPAMRSLLETGSMSYNEFLFGETCPAGGSINVNGAGGQPWSINRRGLTPFENWQGEATLRREPFDVPARFAPFLDLPEDIVAGNVELGLMLSEGPVVQNIGPTSEVTAVFDGSLADIFGIRSGDLITIVDRGAGAPASQIHSMLDGLADRGRVEVVVRGEDGEDRTLLLLRPEDEIALDQLLAAARPSDFGPPDEFVGFRLQLMDDGAFEALDFLSAADWTRYTTSVGEPIWERILTPQPDGSTRYDHMIAAYAVARLALVGDCGHALQGMAVSGGGVWERRVGSTVVGTTDTRFAQSVEVLAPFAGISLRTQFVLHEGIPGYTAVLRDFGQALSGISCDSPARQRLEENKLAYTEVSSR